MQAVGGLCSVGWLCCLMKSTENFPMHIAVVLLVDVVVVMVGCVRRSELFAETQTTARTEHTVALSKQEAVMLRVP